MGTTLALVQFSGESFTSAILGTAECNSLREGKFSQLSTHHVVGGRTLERRLLTQYLGVMEEEMALEPAIRN